MPGLQGGAWHKGTILGHSFQRELQQWELKLSSASSVVQPGDMEPSLSRNSGLIPWEEG